MGVSDLQPPESYPRCALGRFIVPKELQRISKGAHRTLEQHLTTGSGLGSGLGGPGGGSDAGIIARIAPMLELWTARTSTL